MPNNRMASIHLKDDSVRPSEADAMALVLFVSSQVFYQYGSEQCVITSWRDGKHSQHSCHNTGFAVDLRIWYFPKDTNLQHVVQTIRDRLNRHFDVILEKDHIHIEFQPESP